MDYLPSIVQVNQSKKKPVNVTNTDSFPGKYNGYGNKHYTVIKDGLDVSSMGPSIWAVIL